ncbi:MAG: LPS export ABC transporter periplasmic protein LptC [Desulfomonilaceae bacterium]|nr:LPS export ABC transporter periplasmic protein LptC [Desulfomonilaceae bacterium]
MKHKELERWYRLRNIRRGAQLLILVSVVLSISGYAASVFVSRPAPAESPELVESGSRIDNFTYSTPGANPWELEASSAIIADSLDKIELTNPRVVYRGGKGGTIYLSAKVGQLDRKSNNVSAHGDVIIRYKDMKFATGEITYSQANHQAKSSSPVSLEGGDLSLTGKGLKVSIDDEEITIERDVEARLFNVRLVGPKNRLPM